MLSALGGFIAVPHFLEPQLPLPAVDEHLQHYETPLLVVSVALALAGLAAAACLFGGRAERAERLRARFAGAAPLALGQVLRRRALRALASASRWYWISDRVFLRFGDRALIDGTLHGLAALGRGSAGVFGRLQTGSLHLYAWFVLARHRRRAALELAACLTPRS